MKVSSKRHKRVNYLSLLFVLLAIFGTLTYQLEEPMKKYIIAPLFAAIAPTASAELLITAVYDGPLTGGVPKGVELYAATAIDDLSLYGLGSANNGGGSDGVEFTFPGGSLVAGQRLYVASESDGFAAFMGFAPDYTSSAMSINGDDAVELFREGQRVDVFGDVDVDGSGQRWEYTDGWAYRSSARSGASFDPSDWQFSGINALDGAVDNASAVEPIPLGQYGEGGAGDDDGGTDEAPTVPLVLISSLQGSPTTYGSNRFGEADVSPLIGQQVTIEAVVVGDFQDNDGDATRNLSGFYLQEEVADEDGDGLSSEGVFVFSKGFATDVALGDLVRVTGTVEQYFGETQLSKIQQLEVLKADQLSQVAPAVIDLSANTQVTLSQNGNYQPDLEAFEGMWVQFAGKLTLIEQFQLDRFNEVRLIAGSRPYQFSQIHQPDAAQHDLYNRAIAARSIVYDDGLNQQNATIDALQGFAPYREQTAKRMGDQVEQLSGVLDYKWAGNASSSATWRVRATGASDNVFTSTAQSNSPNPRPEQAPQVDGNLVVASFNVLNFFTTLDSGSATTAAGHEPRGANSQAEFDRQLQKLVHAITAMDADVLGLVEIENEFDAINDGSTAIETLVNALNAAAGEARYAYFYPGQRFVGGDAIAVGILYRPAVVTPAAGTRPAVLDDVVAAQLPAFADHDFANQPIFNGPATSRAPLAASFVHNGSGDEFTVVVNHFKSKGASSLTDASDPNFDQQDGAGFWNNRRLQAATAVSQWLQSAPTGLVDEDVMLLGDLNAYAMEQPVQYLLGQGFNKAEDENAYSYVFDGKVGTLDYLLVSDSLMAKLRDRAIWHINADEADALDYNLDFGRSADYFSAATATRNSDHDPVLAGFQFEKPLSAFELAWQLFVSAEESGTLTGASPSATLAARQLQGFAHALAAADGLYSNGKAESACALLELAILTTDGQKKPKDVLAGPALPELHARLVAVQSQWGC